MPDEDTTLEKLKGKAKEAAGKITGSDELAREGQAQQEKAEKQEQADAAEAEAAEAAQEQEDHSGT